MPTAVSILGNVTTEYKVYPNPAREQLNVRMNVNAALDLQMQLTDVSGKAMWKQHVQFNKDKKEISIDMSHLSSGIYFLNIYDKNNKVYEVKVMKD